MQEINTRTPCLFLCAPEDPEDLACKVKDLLADSKKLHYAQDAADNYAHSWSAEWAAAETGKVYGEISI
jgi:hypothetical protein